MSPDADLTITEVEAVHLRLSQIDAERCDGTQDTLLVFVTASDGTVGVGEVDSSPLVAKAVVEAEPSHLIARGLRSILLGPPPAGHRRLLARHGRGQPLLRRRGRRCTRSAASTSRSGTWPARSSACRSPGCSAAPAPTGWTPTPAWSCPTRPAGGRRGRRPVRRAGLPGDQVRLGPDRPGPGVQRGAGPGDPPGGRRRRRGDDRRRAGLGHQDRPADGRHVRGLRHRAGWRSRSRRTTWPATAPCRTARR